MEELKLREKCGFKTLLGKTFLGNNSFNFIVDDSVTNFVPDCQVALYFDRDFNENNHPLLYGQQQLKHNILSSSQYITFVNDWIAAKKNKNKEKDGKVCDNLTFSNSLIFVETDDLSKATLLVRNDQTNLFSICIKFIACEKKQSQDLRKLVDFLGQTLPSCF
jgi:hypothetical protein